MGPIITATTMMMVDRFCRMRLYVAGFVWPLNTNQQKPLNCIMFFTLALGAQASKVERRFVPFKDRICLFSIITIHKLTRSPIITRTIVFPLFPMDVGRERPFQIDSVLHYYPLSFFFLVANNRRPPDA